MLVTGEDAGTSGDLKAHINTQGISAVGLTSGDRYSVIQILKEHFVFSPDGYVDEVDIRFMLVRQGSDDNLWLRQTYRASFPPFELVFIRNETECRG